MTGDVNPSKIDEMWKYCAKKELERRNRIQGGNMDKAVEKILVEFVKVSDEFNNNLTEVLQNFYQKCSYHFVLVTN